MLMPLPSPNRELPHLFFNHVTCIVLSFILCSATSEVHRGVKSTKRPRTCQVSVSGFKQLSATRLLSCLFVHLYILHFELFLPYVAKIILKEWTCTLLQVARLCEFCKNISTSEGGRGLGEQMHNLNSWVY